MNSNEYYQRAQNVIPGGVNSPVRAFKAVGGHPPFIQKGKGSYIYDVDNNAYIDYVGSWGPLILGHAHPKVLETVQATITKGLSYGAPTPVEIEIAEKICEIMPNIDMVRMVNSGTEATMSAIRLARGFTKKDKFIKFEGCYHGHSDALLVKAGSGALTFGTPSSPGVPESFTQHTLVANYNDLDSVEKLFNQYNNEIAAIIIEPIPGNMNFIPPIPGFLEGLRQLCDQHNAILIFDEVMTGFRVSLGGAQSIYNVKPDLTTLGKIIGGGMPVGAFGGRRDIMEQLSPNGPIYQAGTLSGNPVAMAAGLATLNVLTEYNFYPQLQQVTQQLVEGITERANNFNIPMTYNAIGSMFGIFFTEEKKITHYQQVVDGNIDRFKQFFHGMLSEGIYLAPSAFEAGFVSIAHGPDEIEKTLLSAEKVLAKIK